MSRWQHAQNTISNLWVMSQGVCLVLYMHYDLNLKVAQRTVIARTLTPPIGLGA